jgi:copper chaperone CopZ
VDETCYVEPIKKSVPEELLRKADLALLAIAGMGCQNCASRVQNSLLSLEGVYDVDIFLNMAMAEVTFNGQQVSTRMLVDAVAQAGNDGRHNYRAQLITVS